MENQSTVKRDFLLLIALVAMGKLALNLKNSPDSMYPSITQDAINRSINLDISPLMQPESMVENNVSKPIPETAKNELQEAFVFQDLDSNLLKQLDITLNHVKIALELVEPASYNAMQLHSFRKRLSDMRKSYQHIAPGVSKLGPFASAQLISKEEKIQQELLKIVNRVGSILNIVAHHQEEYQEIDSIVAALEANHHVLSKIRSA